MVVFVTLVNNKLRGAMASVFPCGLEGQCYHFSLWMRGAVLSFFALDEWGSAILFFLWIKGYMRGI